MIQRGQRLTLEIEKPAAGGRMLARHAGQIVLVAGAIPGEQVTARVTRVGKGVAFADVEEVLSASHDRRTGASDWRCGGSVYSHIAYPRQRDLKAQIIRDAFTRIGRLPLNALPDVVGSPEAGYRMRARLHVHGDRIGFFREGTHELCDAATTGQLLPATGAWIHAATEALRAITRDNGAPSAPAAIDIAENIPGDQRVAHLELHAGADARRYEALGAGLVGLSAQAADSRAAVVVTGTPVIADEIRTSTGRVTLQRDVRAFFQGNRFLLDTLADRVLALVDDGAVVDLYAGVGLFGLSIAAARASTVTLVEGEPVSGADLARNAAAFDDRVRVHRQSVETFLAGAARQLRAGRPTFVVDPPRTGLSREALAGIIGAEPRRIVYVSCDVATLARDARALVDAGWELTEVSGIDLFPTTAHVESIAVFSRGERRGRGNGFPRSSV